jgi:hypothetical protein
MGSKKLTRSILRYNLVQLCNNIKNPQVPFSLAIQAILLRGVVKIEGKQVSFLFTDSIDARAKLSSVQQAAVPESTSAASAPEPSGAAAPAPSATTSSAAELASASTTLLDGLGQHLDMDLSSQYLLDQGHAPGHAPLETSMLAAAERLGEGRDFTDLSMADLGADLDLGSLDLAGLDVSAGGLGLGLGEGGEDIVFEGVMHDDLDQLQPPSPLDAPAPGSASPGVQLDSLSLMHVGDDAALLLRDAHAAQPSTDAPSASAPASASASARRGRGRGPVVDRSLELPDAVLAAALRSAAHCTGPRPAKRLRADAWSAGEVAAWVGCARGGEWWEEAARDPGLGAAWAAACAEAEAAAGAGRGLRERSDAGMFGAPGAGGAGRGPWVTLVEVVEAARGAGGARAADVGVSLVQLLALAARGAVAVQQRGPYQDIRIARGPAWASFAAAHGAPAGAEGAAGPGTPGAGPGSAPMTPAGAAGRGRRAATEQKARVAGQGRKRKAESDVEASDSEGVMV